MEGDVVLLAEQVLHHTQECSDKYCPTVSPCLLLRGPSVGLTSGSPGFGYLAAKATEVGTPSILTRQELAVPPPVTDKSHSSHPLP